MQMQTMLRLWRCDNSVHQFGIVHLSISRRVNRSIFQPADGGEIHFEIRLFQSTDSVSSE